MNKQNTFTFNHIEKTIIGTKSAIKRASVLGSDEYKILNKMMKEQPTYTVSEKILNKKVESKKTYNGLTLSKMKDYIKTQSNSEENLAKFEKVKEVAKAKNALYPLTKKWFLKTFPSYKDDTTIDEKAAVLKDEVIAELNALEKEVA